VKRLAALVTAALLTSVLGACGTAGTKAEDKLLDALSATQLQSRHLEYDVKSGGQTIGVGVTIEDDYRYASDLSIGSSVAYREVVYDDALAAELVDPDARALLGESTTSKAPLAIGGWMIDELGAPPSVIPAKQVGADPIVDALAYFSYVRDAARASTVRKFDKSALDYRPDEDPFPQPRGGVIRYDVEPTRLPDRSSIERASGADVPEVGDLRKLSIYVRDDHVLEVREAVDVRPFASTLRRAFNAHDATNAELLARINKLRKQIGQLPIVPRSTMLKVTDAGRHLRVALPTGTPTTLQLHVGEVVTAPAPS
jgi:hypothetical protein